MNPFTLSPYSRPELFCDRESETKRILSGISNRRHLTIYSIRRLGKTGLIMHVQGKLSKKYIPVYVDIYDSNDEFDFANKLISATLAALENKKSILQKAIQQFARFRASVVVDPFLGTPTISLDIKEKKDADLSLQLLWQLLKSEKKYTFQIAIDEFQKVTTYENSNIDATLREATQTISNLHFIFSGSQRHLLTELFSDAQKPLFRTTEMMELHPIPYPSYMAFIERIFNEHKKEIGESSIHEILTWTKMHTFFVQYFCHMLFEKTKSKISDHSLHEVKRHIYLENENIYYQFKRLLTKPQWKLLSAVAQENILRQPNSNHLRNTYDLGAVGTINRSLQTLLEKEMIYEQFDSEGKPEYQVYDVFLSRWIQHKGRF